MKFLLFLLVGIVASNATNEREEWLQFKTQHGKSYHNIYEENFRYSIFQTNLGKIQEHNKKYDAGESSYRMAINKFTDMTAEEFRTILGYQQKSEDHNEKSKQYFTAAIEDVPDSFDWRTKGAVTAVKDQGNCGSCWCFSTTGNVEGQYFLKKGTLVSLSEQELVDCDDTCYGCGGGYMDKAMAWIETNGIMSEDDYPYAGFDGTCHLNPAKVAVNISRHEYVKENDENELLKAVANVGPISVAIYANGNFQFYSSGVFDDSTCDPQYLNHGVLCVGYGVSDGKDYWLVKNSWGSSWGMEGYILMSRNKNNQCGIAAQPVYSIIDN